MNLRKLVVTTAIAAFAFACVCNTSRATTLVDWTIDSSKSSIKLAIPDFTYSGVGIRIRNQTGGGSSWTVGNTAFLQGTISTEYEEILNQSIQFKGQSVGQATAINSGNYRPNPAAFNPLNTNSANPNGQYSNTSTAGAGYGVKATTALGDAAFMSISNVSYESQSDVLPVTGGGGSGTFPSNSMLFGILESDFNVDGISIIIAGQLIPDSVASGLDNVVAVNTAPVATLANLGGLLRQMTVTISQPIIIDLGGGVFLNGSATGTLVATAIVPEPSTLAMCSIGFAVVGAGLARRRLRRRQG
jgi:PEP-CTERM motif